MFVIMKPNTKTSLVGSLLIALAATHFTALAQGGPGPEHEALKKLEGTWNAKMKMGDTTGGQADIDTAKGMQPNILAEFAIYAVK